MKQSGNSWVLLRVLAAAPAQRYTQRCMASAVPFPKRPSAVSNDLSDGRFVCDACGQLVIGEPAGHGAYLFLRGTEVRREDAPLCELCALAISAAAFSETEMEEEG